MTPNRLMKLLALLVAGFVLVAITAPAGASPEPTDHPAATTHAAAPTADTADHAPAAADHSGGGHDPHGVVPNSEKQALIPAITALLSFFVVMFVLATTVWPKISGGLEQRAKKIEEEIASAEAARMQAKDALEEYEQNLAQARAESQKMLEETKAQQVELAAQLKAKADADLTIMREKAKADIEAAKKSALSEIYNESVNLASLMAGKILQREVAVGDQQRLVEESLAQMGTTNN